MLLISPPTTTEHLMSLSPMAVAGNFEPLEIMNETGCVVVLKLRLGHWYYHGSPLAKLGLPETSKMSRNALSFS
ncbi:hypothetical protein H5410_010327 [Solanum commersonii]|uniref:Uncharacterized protein n=1 Tax=Solanum commersonii TaxID=4109 RepID=A0A9J6AKE6_SOLCO|nr:hypothetical protein H5410_010327 [Solanum commersonii]